MIIGYEDLTNIRKRHKNKTIGIVKGSWDLFHYDHLQLLKKNKEKVDILVVEVKTDKDLKEKGKNRPIISERERIEIVDSIKYVDYTLLLNEEHTSPLITDLINKNMYNQKNEKKLKKDGYVIEKLKPDIYFYIPNVKPYDSIIDICKELNVKMLKDQNGEFRQHTTDIIEKCKKSWFGGTMKIIGVFGGSGTGKSTASKMINAKIKNSILYPDTF